MISALSQVSLNLNDMLVNSYAQVAELAGNERKYTRSTECYEKLLACLRARAVKTENILKLMQKASQEIIANRLQQIGPEPAREIRRIHAKHDSHNSIHKSLPDLFRRVVYTVSSESPGEYFDSLVDRAHVHKKSAARLVKNSDDDMVTDLETTSEELEAERELACLVELSDAV